IDVDDVVEQTIAPKQGRGICGQSLRLVIAHKNRTVISARQNELVHRPAAEGVRLAELPVVGGLIGLCVKNRREWISVRRLSAFVLVITNVQLVIRGELMINPGGKRPLMSEVGKVAMVRLRTWERRSERNPGRSGKIS